MNDALSGVIVLDKPAGLSSAQALERVKRLVGVRKAGHAGTLDPTATGVLICCLERATRLAGFFVGGTKTYEAELRLGMETDTQDAAGQPLARRPVPALSASQWESTLAAFSGRRLQAPPVFSALKHQGTPLYRLARRGQPLQKPPRPVEITELTLLRRTATGALLRITCSAGTYVRTLCAEIGAALGCGGHLGELRRTRSGEFTVSEALSLEELAEQADHHRLDQAIIPMAEALRHMPAAKVEQAMAGRIGRGAPVTLAELDLPPVDPPARWIKIVDPQGRLVAVAQPEHGTGACPYRCVFHQPDADAGW
jgi:tRNA pseudouridine55 synthase